MNEQYAKDINSFYWTLEGKAAKIMQTENHIPSFFCKLVLTATAWKAIIAFGCMSLLFPTHLFRLKIPAKHVKSGLNLFVVISELAQTVYML